MTGSKVVSSYGATKVWRPSPRCRCSCRALDLALHCSHSRVAIFFVHSKFISLSFLFFFLPSSEFCCISYAVDCGEIESFLRTGMELPRGFGVKIANGTR